MQYQRLTKDQKKIRAFRTKRNHMVATILAKNPHMLSAEALRLANQRMNGKKAKKPKAIKSAAPAEPDFDAVVTSEADEQALADKVEAWRKKEEAEYAPKKPKKVIPKLVCWLCTRDNHQHQGKFPSQCRFCGVTIPK